MSDGWVRCGQCSKVFDATLSLQKMAVPELPPVPEPAPSEPLVCVSAAPPAAHLNEPGPGPRAATAPSAGAETGAGGRGTGTPLQGGIGAHLHAGEDAAPALAAMSREDEGTPRDTGEGEADRAPEQAAEPHFATDPVQVAEPEPEPGRVWDGAPLQAPQPQGYELPAAVLAEENGDIGAADPSRSLEAFSGPERDTDSAGIPLAAYAPDTPDTPHAAQPFTAAETTKNTQGPTFSPVLKAASLSESPTEPDHTAAVATDSGEGGDPYTHGGAPHDGSGVPNPELDASSEGAGAPSSQPLLLPAQALPAPLPLPAPGPGAVSAAQHTGVAVPGASAQDTPAFLVPAAQEPSFVRSARRKALWQRPAVRLALVGCALLLALALLAQVAVQQRHYLASARPQWRAALEALCLPLQCRLQPYRHIASVAVDSSSFHKLHGSTYRLALALQNRSALEVALPAVELTLTDAGEQLLLRRVFTPDQLAAPAALPPAGEWLGTLEMDLQLPGNTDARIAGYRVLAFYP